MEADRIYDSYKKYYEIIGNKIGFGNFGSVFKAKKKDTNEIRAIKIIDIISEDEEEIEKGLKPLINELKNMKICSNNKKNNYSVHFYEYFINEKEFIIVMELCDNSLLKVLKLRKKGFKSEYD